MVPTTPLPDKKYKIIYADPPWQYDDKALAGNRGAGCKYDVMTVYEIMALPVPRITAPECFLFIWGTWALLSQCLDVVKAWGFEYKTLGFLWTKKNKTKGGYSIGMGNYTRANSEYCLLGVKGKPKIMSHKVTQIVDTSARKHSQKPDIIRGRIVRLCGDLPRIELFARKRVPEWDVWGAESVPVDSQLDDFLPMKPGRQQW